MMHIFLFVSYCILHPLGVYFVIFLDISILSCNLTTFVFWNNPGSPLSVLFGCTCEVVYMCYGCYDNGAARLINEMTISNVRWGQHTLHRGSV